jgi:hypothetical protein
MIVFAVTTDNTLKKEWLDSAFIFCGIGYLSFFLFPIIIFQQKVIFREYSRKTMRGIIIVLFYSEIVLFLEFLFTIFLSKNTPLICFSNPGVMFSFSCFERILTKWDKKHKEVVP